ncbi:hypothetical protein Clacol_008560 [Clathrus columnatus]|uniref:F-box domain-containing protein n=1 Tax=Clathrus columnatus TaxID=1419009 RepID=A0AAV5AI27_9AGAM|nr:hypothetical protein Clacol_008560 [Clathrus columnatus]
MSPIFNIPFELLYQIILFIDLPKDLLSFALTCRSFRNIIIPDFLKYCKTRCSFLGDETWSTLAERPILCERVKFLETTFNPWPYLTTQVGPNGTYFQTSPEGAALQKMQNLISFRCNLTDPPSNLVKTITTALKESGCMLKELELNTSWRASHDNTEEYNHSVISLFALNMSSISKVSIASNSFRTRDAQSLWRILSDSPNLTHLQLDVCQIGFIYENPNFIFLTHCHWPRLKHLTIKGFEIRESGNVTTYNSYLQIFLSRHIHLETFYVTSHLTFPVQLPRLQAIGYYPWSPEPEELGTIYSDRKRFLSVSIAQNLTHLFLFSFGPLFDIGETGGFPSLETCVLPPIQVGRHPVHREWLAEFVSVAPRIKKMAITVSRFHHETISKVINTLLPLRELTVLLGLFSSVESSDESKMKTLELAYQHPTLSHVNIELKEENLRADRCVRLLPRGPLDPRPVFEVVPLNVLAPDDWRTKWGGFFRGLNEYSILRFVTNSDTLEQ